MKLRDYLFPAVVIGNFPVTLVNGTTADATQVMQDFNWIQSQVNTNVPALIPATAFAYVPQASVGGTANAITLTPAPAVASYTDGLSFRFVATNTNTGATTIAVSGLSPVNVVVPGATALTGGEIRVNGVYDIAYSSISASWFLQNAAQGSGFFSAVTFSPGIQFGGANVGMTFSVNTGQAYILNGLYVFAIALTLTAKGSSTGVATITGLPYQAPLSLGGSGNVPFGVCQAANLTYAGQISPCLQPSTNTFKIQTSATGSAFAFLSDTAFANNTSLNISGVLPRI